MGMQYAMDKGGGSAHLGLCVFIVYICYMCGRLCNHAPLPHLAWVMEVGVCVVGWWGVCLSEFTAYIYTTPSALGWTLAFVYLREWECGGMVSRRGELNVQKHSFLESCMQGLVPTFSVLLLHGNFFIMNVCFFFPLCITPHKLFITCFVLIDFPILPQINPCYIEMSYRSPRLQFRVLHLICAECLRPPFLTHPQ